MNRDKFLERCSQHLFLGSLGLGFFATILLAALACLPGMDVLGFAFAPGIFGAALVFAEGIHSDHGTLYLLLAGLIQVLLFAAIAFPCVAWFCRRDRTTDDL